MEMILKNRASPSASPKFIDPHREWISKAKKGDEGAMQHLYVSYSKAMLNTAFRILNNKEDAEDVLQDAFLNAFLKIHQFEFQSTFGAWVKRIIVNKSINMLRKRKRDVKLWENCKADFNEYAVPYLHAELEKSTQLDILYKALHQLSDGYRAVFSLFMLEGYNHNEISTILNIEVSTSISQLSRAKKKIKILTNKMITNERI